MHSPSTSSNSIFVVWVVAVLSVRSSKLPIHSPNCVAIGTACGFVDAAAFMTGGSSVMRFWMMVLFACRGGRRRSRRRHGLAFRMRGHGAMKAVHHVLAHGLGGGIGLARGEGGENVPVFLVRRLRAARHRKAAQTQQM